MRQIIWDGFEWKNGKNYLRWREYIYYFKNPEIVIFLGQIPFSLFSLQIMII